MSRIVRCGLIQCSNAIDTSEPVEKIRDAMIEKHLPFIAQAGRQGVKILCLQELFNGPYFCPSQDPKWYGLAEPVPGGPTIQLMQEQAREHAMVIVVPVYEKAMTGVYYNTAAVIDADGAYLGRFRKKHIPHVAGFWEKFFFKPGNEGYPVFDTAYAKIGVYICYDRHFPEGARLLGLHGAEIVFNPSATVAGLSQYLWKLEQPAHAVANGYFMGNINRVGVEAPWKIGKFYGTSYFCDPRGQTVAQGSEDNDELVVGDLDLDLIEEVRNTWQFYRDRRPETYGDMKLLCEAVSDDYLPFEARQTAAAAAIYCLSPSDPVPDTIGLLGYVDDVIVARIALRRLTDAAGEEGLRYAERFPEQFAALDADLELFSSYLGEAMGWLEARLERYLKKTRYKGKDAAAYASSEAGEFLYEELQDFTTRYEIDDEAASRLHSGRPILALFGSKRLEEAKRIG